MNILEIRGLTKDYGDVRAVDNLSLDIEKGEIFALLGPNGAGKTTTIKSILGVIFPTKGEIKINGFDVIKEGRKARKNIGYLPERVAFYDNLTAIQTMEFYAELRGASMKECVELLK
ncbi:MAG: ATP-binding cassette domain-containing protein, partial [Thermoplasmata archaeon]|nr:ATP-binding cassette domain-containing protein [Thermoplasmata archaeon]